MKAGGRKSLTTTDPKVQEAVRLYTDPLSPHFGNKTAAGLAVGAPSEAAAVAMLSTKQAKEAIARIEADRARRGKHVADYLGHYSPEAAHELVRQISTGLELETRDPQTHFDTLVERVAEAVRDVLSGYGGDEDEERDLEDLVTYAVGAVLSKQLDIIDQTTKANRVALQGARERRESLKIVLAYHLGTPEQRVRLAVDEKDPELDLSTLSDAELAQLREGLELAMEIRKREEAGPDDEADPEPADFEILP